MGKSRVEGTRELAKKLRSLEPNIRRELRSEVKAAGDLIDAAVDRVAPHQSIAQATTAKASRSGLGVLVGLQNARAARKGFLLRIFEFGTKRHVIATGGATIRTGTRGEKRKRFRGKGGWILAAWSGSRGGAGQFFGKIVDHPGTKARPFFFNTVERLRPSIIAHLTKAVQRALRMR